MARVICIANQKGGVGKTTTSVNLAAALSKRTNRVLIVDMDPQGNASSGLGIKRYDTQDSNIYHVLIGEKNIDECINQSNLKNLSLVSANPDLVGAEIELVDMPQREFRLKKAIKSIDEKFDYVLIDCPPSLGLLTVNALSAADTFLVPLQCEYYALEGLSQLLNTAGIIKKNLNPNLKIEGIVLTMFDKRNNLSHQVVTEIRDHFGDKVFKSVIPRNVRLSEAPSHGQSIFGYDDKSIGAKRYLELAEELDINVKREGVTACNNKEKLEQDSASKEVDEADQHEYSLESSEKAEEFDNVGKPDQLSGLEEKDRLKPPVTANNLDDHLSTSSKGEIEGDLMLSSQEKSDLSTNVDKSTYAKEKEEPSIEALSNLNHEEVSFEDEKAFDVDELNKVNKDNNMSKAADKEASFIKLAEDGLNETAAVDASSENRGDIYV